MIFRNSLQSSNEHEWMCVICGYDNRPRATDCPMCGTCKKFTIDYKTEKKDKYKKKLEKEERKKKNNVNKNLFFNSSVTQDDSLGLDDSRLSQLTRRVSMSAIERLEALNYRRLNALSLRQKGARRRRMWTRVLDEETGELKWGRQTAHKTPIGSDGKHLAYDPRSSLCSPTKRNTLDVLSPLRDSLLKGAPRDSFDEALVSSSPGFTSVFDEGGDLLWERVENGAVMAQPIPSIRPILPETYDINIVDIQSVVALNMKEKQLWFLKCLSLIQRPWEEGCIRISVDREKILEHSIIQFGMLQLDELHRFMRVQFIGEQGIDAGSNFSLENKQSN